MFTISREEFASLRSQIVTLKPGRGRHSKYLPNAFTEQGVAMLSSVLHSEKAIKTNIAIIRAFVAMRQLILGNNDLQQKITDLEKKYDKQFKDVFQVLDFLVAKKKKEEENKARQPIGFIRPESGEPSNRIKQTKTKNA